MTKHHLVCALSILQLCSSAFAATLTVSTPNDAAVPASTATLNDCTLREALHAIEITQNFDGCNNGSAEAYGTNDRIEFASNVGNIILNHGPLLLTKDVVIDGNDSPVAHPAGTNVVTLTAKTRTPFPTTNPYHSVILVGEPLLSGSRPTSVVLKDLVITNGSDSGIISTAVPELDIIGCEISGNTTFSGSNGNGVGGGLTIYGGRIRIIDTAIHDNHSYNGGGIFFHTSSSTPMDAALIQRSSIYRNTAATAEGGGFTSFNFALIEIQNSTIESNVTGGVGGAITHFGGDLRVSFSTITNNYADAAASDRGDGIYHVREPSMPVNRVAFYGSILAGNTCPSTLPPTPTPNCDGFGSTDVAVSNALNAGSDFLYFGNGHNYFGTWQSGVGINTPIGPVGANKQYLEGSTLPFSGVASGVPLTGPWNPLTQKGTALNLTRVLRNGHVFYQTEWTDVTRRSIGVDEVPCSFPNFSSGSGMGSTAANMFEESSTGTRVHDKDQIFIPRGFDQGLGQVPPASTGPLVKCDAGPFELGTSAPFAIGTPIANPEIPKIDEDAPMKIIVHPNPIRVSKNQPLKIKILNRQVGTEDLTLRLVDTQGETVWTDSGLVLESNQTLKIQNEDLPNAQGAYVIQVEDPKSKARISKLLSVTD